MMLLFTGSYSLCLLERSRNIYKYSYGTVEWFLGDRGPHSRDTKEKDLRWWLELALFVCVECGNVKKKKKVKEIWTQWCTPAVLGIQEAEAGGSQVSQGYRVFVQKTKTKLTKWVGIWGGKQVHVCTSLPILRWADSQDILSIFGKSKLPTCMLNGILFLLKYARKNIYRAALMWQTLSWGVKWVK